jgi:putative FmdB family regulatory protein
MPLYEFYCEPCHTIYTFRSPRVDTCTVPACPACGAGLRREVSSFAHIAGGARAPDAAEDGESAGRMEQVMAEMGERIQALDDEDADPREAVRAMHEMAAAGGLNFNAEVREAMARIEAGEDPEKIDEQFAEVFEADSPFAEPDGEAAGRASDVWRRLRGPQRDPTWHDLQPGSGGADGSAR